MVLMIQKLLLAMERVPITIILFVVNYLHSIFGGKGHSNQHYKITQLVIVIRRLDYEKNKLIGEAVNRQNESR